MRSVFPSGIEHDGWIVVPSISEADISEFSNEFIFHILYFLHSFHTFTARYASSRMDFTFVDCLEFCNVGIILSNMRFTTSDIQSINCFFDFLRGFMIFFCAFFDDVVFFSNNLLYYCVYLFLRW